MKVLAVCACAGFLGFGTGVQAAAQPDGVRLCTVNTGAVAWFDLTVTNPQISEAFYAEVFGWQFVSESPEYTRILVDGSGIGGLYRAASEAGHGGVTIYFPVANLDATLSRAEASGATVVLTPMPIPGGRGTMAMFRDGDGNTVGLIQSETK